MDNATIKAICVDLSAKGSINFPKSETKLKRLAIIPSKISESPEIVKNAMAHIKLCFSTEITINGININLNIVREFGTYFSMDIPPFLIFYIKF